MSATTWVHAVAGWSDLTFDPLDGVFLSATRHPYLYLDSLCPVVT